MDIHHSPVWEWIVNAPSDFELQVDGMESVEFHIARPLLLYHLHLLVSLNVGLWLLSLIIGKTWLVDFVWCVAFCTSAECEPHQVNLPARVGHCGHLFNFS